MGTPIRVLHVDGVGEPAVGPGALGERTTDEFEVVAATDEWPAPEGHNGDEIDCVVYESRPVAGEPVLPGLDSRDAIGDVALVVLLDDEVPDVTTADVATAVATSLPDGLTRWVRASEFEAEPDALTTTVERALDDVGARRERDRYRRLVNTVGDPMYVLEPDGTVSFANEATLEMLDCEREDVVGSHASRLVVEERDYERGTDLLGDILADPERDWGTHDTTVESATGEAIPVEINLAPLLDDTGSHRATAGVVRDISEHKRREQRLAALHDTTRSLIEATDLAAAAQIAVDAAADVLDLEMASFFRPTADGDALEPVALTDSVHEVLDEVPTFTRPEGLIWQAFDEGDPIFAENVRDVTGVYNPDTPIESELLIPADGHGVFVAASTEPAAFDATDEELAGVLVTNLARAIESARREDRLRERERELERQNERLETFAHIASHDLRTPLNVAEGRLTLAMEDCDSEHLDAVEDALYRMETLVDDTLTMAKGGQSVSSVELIELDELCFECWSAVADGPASLEVRDEIAVRGDPKRLERVVENLMRNAVEHGPDDVTVWIGTIDDEGFYVADDGPGIPEAERSTVFEAGHTTADDGTGFGLAIVEDIVEAHGWSIAVGESDAGGARFEITGVECE